MPILLDVETRSACDLRTEGGRNYAAHPSTEVLTVAWIDGVTRHVWFPGLTDAPEHLTSQQLPGARLYFGPACPIPSGTKLVAHNATGFDSLIMARYGQFEWEDSEPLARQCGLPGGLDKIGERLRGQGKFKEGKSRLLKFTKADTKPPKVGDLIMIAKYCLDDVEILKLLWEYVQSRQPSDHERRVYTAHKAINSRGIRLDLDLCRKLEHLSIEATRRTIDKIRTLTDGKLDGIDDLRSRTKVFSWIEGQNAKVGKSLRKDALETLFREHDEDGEEDEGTEIRLTPLVREVLTARFSALRISGAKVAAAYAAAHHSRLHDILVYFGAHTGRWSGRKLQPQNLPRPKSGVDVWKLYDTDLSVEAVLANIPDTCTLDDAVSGMIRGILIPDDGYMFAAADYNAIELRVLGWLAGEDKILRYFREKQCPYMAMASKIYGTPITDRKDPRRQVGKVVVLGCGYQLGEAKMGLYALAQGIDLEAAGVTPSQCVNAFRDEFPEVAGEMTTGGWREGGLWNGLNYAAMAAMRNGKASYRMIDFRYDGRDLKMFLPSGRPIYYCGAKVEDVVTKWGQIKKAVTYLSPHNFRNVLYPGKYTENCWAGETEVLTAEGWKRIDSVTNLDRVWDGEKWVSTDGNINQGNREVGEWLGNRVTADHLIFDGMTWSSVIHADASFVERSLKWGVASVNCALSKKPHRDKEASYLVNANAGIGFKFVEGDSCGMRHRVALNVDGNEQPPLFGRTSGIFRMSESDNYGRIGTLGSCLDATTLVAPPTKITGDAEFECSISGSKIAISFSSTPGPWRDGITLNWNSTEKITTDTTHRETLDSLPEVSIPTIVETPSVSNIKVSNIQPRISERSSVRSGAEIQLGTIEKMEGRSNGLWIFTGQREEVFDLVNCGPRNRFTVRTKYGPVIVHNCCQAVARDVLADPIIRESDKIVLHVHDEAVAQVRDNAEAEAFTKAMLPQNSWAAGLPLAVECDTMPRYAKSSPKGWKQYAA